MLTVWPDSAGYPTSRLVMFPVTVAVLPAVIVVGKPEALIFGDAVATNTGVPLSPGVPVR